MQTLPWRLAAAAVAIAVLSAACTGAPDPHPVSSGLCGNGGVEDGEVCDDGNVVDADGCSSTCASDETCGNGIVDVAAGEVCDPGVVTSGINLFCAPGCLGPIIIPL